MFRKVTVKDKERIVELSSKIWDGEDYIGDVFDEWVSDKNREFICMAGNNKIYGFASMKMMPDETVWFEGLRIDPDYKGRGLGKKLTEFFIEKVRRKGKIIRLATYFKNYESLHIVRKYGFKKIRGYSLLEKEVQDTGLLPEWANINLSGSDFIPIDWVFYANNEKNRVYLWEKIFAIGTEKEQILVSVSDKKGRENAINIFKIDPGNMANIDNHLKMAEKFAAMRECKYLRTMIPYSEEFVKIALSYGFHQWEDAKENVILLEKHF